MGKKQAKKKKFQRQRRGERKVREHQRDRVRKAAGKEITGVFTGTRQGFGFVKVDSVFGEKADVFIPPHAVNGAFSGDRVKVRLEHLSENDRRARLKVGKGPGGEVVQITERSTDALVGVVHRQTQGNGWFADIRLDGFPDVLLEDLPKGVHEGDLVSVKIERYPGGRDREPLGRVIAHLGKVGDPAAEERSVLLKNRWPEKHTDSSNREALGFATTVQESDTRGRRDLREKLLFTIDGAKARDFDDAVGVEELPGGRYRLYVAIADVAHYVRPGSAIDMEAYRRSTSVYFPTRAIHMLPEALSAGLCSLLPNQDRLAMVAELVFDAQGRKLESQFYNGVFRSRARLTYDEVETVLKTEHFKAHEPKVVPITDASTREAVRQNLIILRRLERAMRQRRKERGSLNFDLPEALFIFDGKETDYKISEILRGTRLEAHELIEEFMIAANEAVAEALTKADYPCPYRIHEPPDPMKIQDFLALLEKMPEAKLTKDELRHWSKPGVLATVLERTKDHPAARHLHQMLLQSLKLAAYSPANKGHFGLASECYSHFTSPIRRYPDLMLHRVLKSYIAREKPPFTFDQLRQWCEHCFTQEQIAVTAEREVVQFYKVRHMSGRLGEVFDGRVVHVTHQGFFAELDQVFVDGFAALEHLPKDFYGFDAKLQTLRGRQYSYTVGDPVRVQVARADLDRRRLDFAVEAAADDSD